MRYPSSDTIKARIVKNPRAAQKVKLAALASMLRPSLVMLKRLLADQKTGSRLLALAAERYETELARRELRRNAKSRSSRNDREKFE
jgi:hypothetical protein